MKEFTLRFLVIGLIITILIGFGVWWFFIHTSTDRIVEENGIKFVKAVDAACETNQPVYLDFQMPQPFVASLKEKTEEFFNWVSKKIGLGGPEINIPIQAFNDPYYKIYWEYFPPDPPYSFGEGVAETMASIFAPWSEDLPWSTNFMLTLTFDSFFLGFDIFGVGKVKGAITSSGRMIANKISHKLSSISPDEYEKMRRIFNAIENKADIIVENVGKAGKVVIKGGKLLVKEGRFVGTITTFYTIFCLFTQDKTLGECLVDGVIVGIGADVGKIVAKKYAWPKIVEVWHGRKLKELKKGFSIEFKDFKKSFSESIDEIYEKDVIPSLEYDIKGMGFKYDKKLNRFVASIDDDVAREEVINPLQKYLDEVYGYPNRVKDFEIVYDKDGITIKEVIFDPKTFIDKFKEKILYPIEEKLGKLSEKIMSNKMLDSEGFGSVSYLTKEYFKLYPERAVRFLKLNGIKVKDSDEALRILSYRLNRLERQVEEGGFFVVVEKNSRLEALINDIDAYHNSRVSVITYLNNIIENGDKEEAKNFWNLLNGKRLRIKEDIETFSRGTFGYMFLRVQDLYTPLGATYWDRYFSTYGYPSLEAQKKGFCQTQCEDGKICVQLGACVREFDLPDSCTNKGVSSINLRRDSIVASNPRFYLVSPCYAKLKIYIKDNTLYVEPYMKIEDKKNYCYATGSLVNWYVGTEIAAYTARCVSATLCAIATVGAGALDAILACVGIGKGFTGVCSIASNLAGLLVDMFREMTLVYPDVYKNMPGLIDFKL